MNKKEDFRCNCISGKFIPHRKSKCLTSKVIKNLDQHDQVIQSTNNSIRKKSPEPVDNIEFHSTDNANLVPYLEINNNNNTQQLQDIITSLASENGISMIIDILMKECITSENIADLMKMINKVENNATSKISEDSCNCLSSKYIPHRKNKCLATKMIEELEERDGAIWIDDHYIRALDTSNKTESASIDNDNINNDNISCIDTHKVDDNSTERTELESSSQLNDGPTILNNAINFTSQHEISMIIDILMKECITSENIADLMKMINKVENNATSKISEDICNCLSSKYIPHRKNKCLATKMIEELEERDGAIWIDDHYIRALDTSNETANTDNDNISNDNISSNINTREFYAKMIKEDNTHTVKCDILNKKKVKENSKQNILLIDEETQKKLDEQERIIQLMQLQQQEIINIQKKQEKCLQSQQFINMQRQQYINMLKLRITELEKEKYKEANFINNHNYNMNNHNCIAIIDLDSNLDDESLTIVSDDID